MHTIPESTDERNHRSRLAMTLAAQAVKAYPAEIKRIRKALSIVQGERIYLGSDGVCFVEGSVYPGQYYRLEGKHCTCPAVVERCCHLWARALLKRVIAEMDIPAQGPPQARTYAAHLAGAPDVIGEARETPEGIEVNINGVPLATYCDRADVVLLGEHSVASEQRAIDGDYARKVCGY